MEGNFWGIRKNPFSRQKPQLKGPLQRSFEEREKARREIEEKYGRFKAKRIDPLYDALFKNASKSNKFTQYSSDQFIQHLKGILSASKIAQENLNNFLSGTNTTGNPSPYVEVLTRSLKSLQKLYRDLEKYTKKEVIDAEFKRNISQMKEDIKSLPFVNISQFTESLSKDQQTYDQVAQQMTDYFSGRNAEINTMQVLEQLNQFNNETRVKGVFIYKISSLIQTKEIKVINDKINIISKNLIKIHEYFFEVGQSKFAERLNDILKYQQDAEDDIDAYLDKIHEENDRRLDKEIKDGKIHSLNGKQIEQIVVTPTKEQLDSTLSRLQQVYDNYETLKKAWAPFLYQLEMGKSPDEIKEFMQAWSKLRQERHTLQSLFIEGKEQHNLVKPKIEDSQIYSIVSSWKGSLEQSRQEIKSAQSALEDSTKSAEELLKLTQDLRELEKDILKRRSSILSAIEERMRKPAREGYAFWEKNTSEFPPFSEEQKKYIVDHYNKITDQSIDVFKEYNHIKNLYGIFRIFKVREDLNELSIFYNFLPNRAEARPEWFTKQDYQDIVNVQKDNRPIDDFFQGISDMADLELSESLDTNRKELNNWLQSQLQVANQQCHKLWKYGTIDRYDLIQANYPESFFDTLYNDYKQYITIINDTTKYINSDSKTVKDLCNHIIALCNHNRLKEYLLLSIDSQIQNFSPASQAPLGEETLLEFSVPDVLSNMKYEEQRKICYVLEPASNEEHPNKEMYDELVKEVKRIFMGIIATLETGIDSKWESNRQTREEMRLIQEYADHMKNLMNEGKDVSAMIANVRIWVNHLAKPVDIWIQGQVHEFEEIYDEAGKLLLKQNDTKIDYDKLEELTDKFRIAYDKIGNYENKDNLLKIIREITDSKIILQELKETILGYKRQEAHSYFNIIFKDLGFKESTYEQFVRGEWDLRNQEYWDRQEPLSLAIELAAVGFQDAVRQNIERIFKDVYLDPTANLKTLNIAINELSDLPNRLRKRLEEEKDATQQLAKGVKSLSKTWQQILDRGTLPGTEDLRNIDPDEISDVFTLGRHHRDSEGNLRNNVFAEPYYCARMVDAAQFMLKTLDTELSAEYLEDLYYQCARGTTVCKTNFTSSIQNTSVYSELGQRGGGVWIKIGRILRKDPLRDGGNYSDKGFEELCAMYDGRTGGTKTHDRYPSGHPVGDLCYKDPRIFLKNENPVYVSRALKKGESRKFVQIAIDKFHEEIKAAGSDKDKIFDAIVYFCKILFIMHLYADRNTRFTVGLVFPMLLLKYGLRPPIVENPPEAKFLALFSLEESKQFGRELQGNFGRRMKSVGTSVSTD